MIASKSKPELSCLSSYLKRRIGHDSCKQLRGYRAACVVLLYVAFSRFDILLKLSPSIANRDRGQAAANAVSSSACISRFEVPATIRPSS